jgi:tetraacyldisaccharide 4'-kinase
MAGGVKARLAAAGAALYGAAWETRRAVYARGWRRPRRVSARVVSIGNLTVGGTGKTTLTLHLARRLIERGIRCAVVCRDYRADRSGMSDEAYLFRAALDGDGEPRVFVGASKRERAAAAAAAGFETVLVDDGFSTWSLERDLDVVLVDAHDPWGGGALLPAGRLREPRRALQRAAVVVVSRLGPAEDPEVCLREVAGVAPAALLAAGRHRVGGVVPLQEGQRLPASRRVRVVTGTGNPQAVVTTAGEAGLEVTSLSSYRDHHWFSDGEARRELEAAGREDAAVLLTAKDAVRWRPQPHTTPVVVLSVTWEWVRGGEAVEQLVLGGGDERIL